MPSLAEFQREFAACVLSPSIAADPGSAIGMRVHSNTIMKGLVDALLANYPTVGVLMGMEWLTDAARLYARTHLPSHAVLAGYGESFPAFLATQDVNGDWPFLRGVAALDRAWTESFLAPDSPVLTVERLAGIDPRFLGSQHLKLHPAARLACHNNSAVTIWEANRPPAIPPAELSIDGKDEAALMLRNDSGVQLLRLDATEHIFLKAIVTGHPVGAAAVRALEIVPGGDVARCWSRLLTHGAFADIEFAGD